MLAKQLIHKSERAKKYINISKKLEECDNPALLVDEGIYSIDEVFDFLCDNSTREVFIDVS